MKHSHVKWTGLAERLSIQEAAGLVVKETGKSLDYTITFLTDCAEQGYFAAEVVPRLVCANVTHIPRVDPSKSTISTAELIEWLDGEIEDAHQKARDAVARKETEKWGYDVRPEDVHVILTPSWSELLDRLSQDATYSLSAEGWAEYLAREFAEKQGWREDEYRAKFPTIKAQFARPFIFMCKTLPLHEHPSGVRWRFTLPEGWFTELYIEKSALREWATTHAPEIAKSRLLAKPNPATANTEPPEPATESAPPADAGTTGEDVAANGDDWRVKAREIADELFDYDTAHNTRDGLVRKNGRGEYAGGYAYRVMEAMQQRNIHGPRGRIDNAGTVAREALQGDKWWGKKKK
jgi:hypothetical protein